MKNYTIIFLALFLISNYRTSGQIVYTDVNPDSTVSASVSEVIKSYYIDLDNNGIYEFELRHFNPGAGFEAVELQQNLEGIKQVIINPNGHAKVLYLNDSVSPNSLQWGADIAGILNDPWYGAGEKYFGFRFKISGLWHYAWARVIMPADHLSFTIMDYAYNQEPDAPILAGQTSQEGINGNPDESNGFISIYPNPVLSSAVIKFSGTVKNAEMIFFNSHGQKIKTITHISGRDYLLSRGNLLPGIYFYEFLRDDNIRLTGKVIISG